MTTFYTGPAPLLKVPCTLMLRLCLLCLIATTSFQCKKVFTKTTPTPDGEAIAYDYKPVQNWFDKNWRKSASSQIAARGEYGDTIPWDFVADRLRKIEPDWTAGRSFQYNGLTLYEVPTGTTWPANDHYTLSMSSCRNLASLFGFCFLHVPVWV